MPPHKVAWSRGGIENTTVARRPVLQTGAPAVNRGGGRAASQIYVVGSAATVAAPARSSFESSWLDSDWNSAR